jgi:hypothetical protein
LAAAWGEARFLEAPVVVAGEGQPAGEVLLAVPRASLRSRGFRRHEDRFKLVEAAPHALQARALERPARVILGHGYRVKVDERLHAVEEYEFMGNLGQARSPY